MISIVTPSFNQGRFIEETIASVLDQGCSDLEYIVIDGGSDDETLDIIKKYENRLAHWVSEPDGGQYDALNKGFAKSTGEIMGWLNSDDKYTPWTLSVAAEIFRQLPEVEWLTSMYPLVWDEKGRAVRCAPRGPFNGNDFFKGDNLPGMGRQATGWIQQEATFWRRSLWERAGGSLDASMRYAGDFDLWARFFKFGVLYAVDVPLGGFRRYGAQKTGTAPDKYKQEALQALLRHGGKPRRQSVAALVHGCKRVCPNRLKPLMSKLGLLTLGKVCAFDTDHGRWGVIEK